MPFDSREQRKIMGQFATGVTVVGMQVGDEIWGMTANAVTSLSLQPPLILVAVQKESQTHQYLNQAQCFAVSILSEEQEALSSRFAFEGPKDFTGLNTTTDETGAPILEGSLGYVDCKLREVLPGGDHDIFIGEIVAGELGEGRPLLYFAGKYARLADDAE